MIKVQFEFCIFQITICFIKLVNVQVTHTVVITYVHEMFRSEEVIIDQTATGWEHLTVQISHCKPNSKKVCSE